MSLKILEFTEHVQDDVLMACLNKHLKYKQYQFCTKPSFFKAVDDSYCTHQLQWIKQCLTPCQKMITVLFFFPVDINID